MSKGGNGGHGLCQQRKTRGWMGDIHLSIFPHLLVGRQQGRLQMVSKCPQDDATSFKDKMIAKCPNSCNRLALY